MLRQRKLKNRCKHKSNNLCRVFIVNKVYLADFTLKTSLNFKMSDIGSEEFDEDEGINLGVSENRFLSSLHDRNCKANWQMSILSWMCQFLFDQSLLKSEIPFSIGWFSMSQPYPEKVDVKLQNFVQIFRLNARWRRGHLEIVSARQIDCLVIHKIIFSHAPFFPAHASTFVQKKTINDGGDCKSYIKRAPFVP